MKILFYINLNVITHFLFTHLASRVRVATLNLVLFLLVLVTRDTSRKCQLTENQLQHLEAAFLESRNILCDLYLVSFNVVLNYS